MDLPFLLDSAPRGQRLCRFHGPTEVLCPQGPDGHRVEISADYEPAKFWSATVTSPQGCSRVFSTGSGNDIGKLLRRLCDAFQVGGAHLDLCYDSSGRTPLMSAEVEEDGRSCDVTAVEDGWHELFLDESSSLLGMRPARAFHIKDLALAQAVAKAFGEGMLTISKA